MAVMPQPQPATSKIPEFDALRRRVQSQYATKRSEGEDAMKRRFASSGMLNSGAAQKSARVQDLELARAEQEALGGLDFQEMSELQRRREITEGRQFQTGEREATQQFTRGMFDTDLGFKGKVFDAEQGWKAADEKFRQQEFDENKRTNTINAALGFADSEVDPQRANEVFQTLSDLGYLPGNFQVPGFNPGGGYGYGQAQARPSTATRPVPQSPGLPQYGISGAFMRRLGYA